MLEVKNKQNYGLKKFYIWRLCLSGIIVALCFVIYSKHLFRFSMFVSKPVNELNSYMGATTPNCINPLENLTKGRWVKAKKYNYDLEQELNEIHIQYRKKIGISTTPWRNDDKCGYNILMKKISKWPQTGTFCNPRGPTTCCTNLFKGKCVSVNRTMTCECATCVNTSQYTDALLAEWTTHDTK